jgi:predicted GIY-YIG superfamily endonuclease
MPVKTTEHGWWLYIVECADKSLYTGITNNLEQRIAKHNAGTASRYTRTRTPVRLVYQEAHPDRSHASRRENQVKRLSRDEKRLLISGVRR